MEPRVPEVDRTAPDRRVACCCGDRRQRALGTGDRVRRRERPLDSRSRPARLGRGRGDGARAGRHRCRRRLRLPRRRLARAHRRALLECLLARHRGGRRTGRRRRRRHHALQRRDHRGERRGACEGVRGRRRRGRIERDEPRRLRDAGGRDAESARPARRLGLPDRARAGRRGARCGRDEERARRRQRAARRPHGRPRRLADGHRDPRRPRRGGGVDTGRRPVRIDADADDDHGEARSPRRRAHEGAEAAAEAARARDLEPAWSGLPACRRPTCRRRSRPPATSSPSTARRRSSTASAARAPASAGITARTSSRRSGRRCWRSPTGPSSRSAGTTWAVTASGCATGRATSSTTRTSLRSRRSLSTATRCKAGDVVGFVGNTGDAQTTPYHLHFEIHPVGLLPLGYDGVVNAFPYLSAWRRLEDITFAAGRGWAPPVPSNATAPRPAAILLGSTDISSASGLDPGSLDRALTAPVSQGDSAALGAG